MTGFGRHFGGGGQPAMLNKPGDNEYAPFYAGYISRVPEHDVLAVLEHQVGNLRKVASAVPVDHERYRYASGKWTIREVFSHLIDAERVFGYRAFCIARGERASLPAFDENDYVKESGANDQPLPRLVEEFAAVRAANLAALKRVSPEAWTRIGTANNHPISVRALAFIMAGHVRHHDHILRTRYEVAAQPVMPE
jgi:hypothetical protein